MNGMFIKVTGSLARLFKSVHLPLLIASVVASMMLVGASFQPSYALLNLTEEPEVVASPGLVGANLIQSPGFEEENSGEVWEGSGRGAGE